MTNENFHLRLRRNGEFEVMDIEFTRLSAKKFYFFNLLVQIIEQEFDLHVLPSDTFQYFFFT